MDLENKNVFVVLGMARSGTSAITRGLKALGVNLGDKLTKPNKKWNPKGFWEDNDIVYKINGSVFSALDFQIYGIKTLDRTLQVSHQLNDIRQMAIKLLKERFLNTQYWGFKDPSTIKLLPFWQSIFEEVKLKENYIIALRNPLSVASSYHSLTGSDLEIGLLLWLMHLVEAIDQTHGKKRMVVSYELLLNNPKAQLDRVREGFNVPLASSEEINHYVNQFLDKKLHHFNHEDFIAHPVMKVVPLCISVYDLLLRLAKDEIAFEDEFFSVWKNIKNELDKMYPVYCYMDTLLKKVNDLERTLKIMQKSILWKALFPFRKIRDILRAYKKRSLASKRLKKAYG